MTADRRFLRASQDPSTRIAGKFPASVKADVPGFFSYRKNLGWGFAMEIADRIKDVALALAWVAAAVVVTRGTYKLITGGVAATLARERKEREQEKINRRNQGIPHS